MAKAFATEAAQRIVDDAVQILGGAGVLAVAPGRPALPRGARAAHLRGHDRDPASRDRRTAAQGDAGVNAVSHRRRPGRAVLRAAAQEGRSRARGRRSTSATGSRTPSASASCSRTRPRRRWHQADPAVTAAMASPQPPLGRHRDPLPRRAASLDRARLLGTLAQDAALDPGRRAAVSSACSCASSARLRDPDAVARRRPGARGRRRQFAGARALRAALSARRRRRPQPVRVARHHAPFPAFTFYFQARPRTACGASHAYQYEPGALDVHRRGARGDLARGRARSREREPKRIAFCEQLFADELEGHRLISNRSIWRSFPTMRNEHWHHGNVVLVGDAAHTAHFSVGSGTKLAMEDAIALVRALRCARATCPTALAAYEARAAPGGREPAARGAGEPPVVRGHRALHGAGAAPVRVHAADAQPARHAREPEAARSRSSSRAWTSWFAERGGADSRSARRPVTLPTMPPPPPMFTPSACADLTLANRIVVSPMCQYSATTACPTTGIWCTSARAPSAAPGSCSPR